MKLYSNTVRNRIFFTLTTTFTTTSVICSPTLSPGIVGASATGPWPCYETSTLETLKSGVVQAMRNDVPDPPRQARSCQYKTG